MKKIITPLDAALISMEQKALNKKVVLVGGCFDILHVGHIKFLEEAREKGDILFVLLESDANIRRKKGKNRPINPSKYRSTVLTTLLSVNYVIPLQGVTKDKEYDKLIVQICPNIIAMTQGDSQIERRKTQCLLVGAKLELITTIVEGKSTTELAKKIL